jgi:hypothetical protein
MRTIRVGERVSIGSSALVGSIWGGEGPLRMQTGQTILDVSGCELEGWDREVLDSC